MDILKEDKNIKIISIPYKLKSLDFQIDDFSCKGNDDSYYNNNPNSLQPRGLAIIYIDNEIKATINGLPKFGYITDNFNDLTDDSFKPSQRIYINKENGEAGHLSFFINDKKWYAIIGSKNVHIIICVDSFDEANNDLNYYRLQNKTRLTCAINNSELLLKYHSDELINNIGMKQYLFDNKLTIIYEAINNNHIIKYDKEQIIAFALTKSKTDLINVINPLEALILLKLWKFNIPQYDCCYYYDTNEINKLNIKYETLENSEGAVVYDIYYKEKTVIVGKIYKHKCYSYVIKRMARELIKRNANFISWNIRFNQSHIEIKIEDINKLLSFYVWLVLNKEKENWSEYIHQNFISLYDEFLLTSDYNNYYNQAPTILQDKNINNITQVIMLVGIQGSGKTTIRNILKTTNKYIKYINQDELGSKKNFICELKKSYNKDSILVIDKCNTQLFHRNDIYQYFSNILIVEFIHPENNLIEVCLSRIKERGANHPSLPFSYDVKNIIETCYNNYEQITNYEKQTHKYISISIMNTIEYNVKQILESIDMDYQVDIDFNQIDIDYKKSILNKSLKNALYIRASANSVDILTKVQLILDKLETKYIYKNEFHLTLYFGKYKEDNIKYFNNIYISVHAESIIYDNKCIVIKITNDGSFICNNINPHITLGCIENIKSVYANEMLEKMENINIIDCDFNIDLVVNPNYRI